MMMVMMMMMTVMMMAMMMINVTNALMDTLYFHDHNHDV